MSVIVDSHFALAAQVIDRGGANSLPSRGCSFCDYSNRLLGSLLVIFLRDRCWLVGACVFHIQPAKRTLRMSTFVLPVAEIVPRPAPPMCDEMVWLALFTVQSGAWTSPLLSPGVPSVIVLVKIGQSRRLQQTV